MNDALHARKMRKKTSFIYFLRLLKTALQIVILAVFTGMYFGRLFFGDNGTEVLTELSARIERLHSQIEELNQTNARLQKEYFELKSIQAN